MCSTSAIDLLLAYAVSRSKGEGIFVWDVSQRHIKVTPITEQQKGGGGGGRVWDGGK